MPFGPISTSGTKRDGPAKNGFTASASLSKWLLLLLLFLLPVMKPAVAYPVIAADLVFLLVLLATGVELLTGRRRLHWRPGYWVFVVYVCGLAASVIASEDPAGSAFKLATTVYLVALAVVADTLIESERDLRAAALAWLAGTALVVAVALAALAFFPFAPNSPLVEYARFHFGTLPPGSYPRLSLTFFNANMLCNYLTVSIGLLLVARHSGWLSRRSSGLLLAGVLVSAVFTISPGLGGVALALALWVALEVRGRRPQLARLAIWAGACVAVLFVAALAVTPILHWTAPFAFTIPGTGVVLAPSGRFLAWVAAAEEFARHPLLGHGIGIDAVSVRYADPSGNLQTLTDAHNMFLSIAAQAGVVGLAALLVLIVYVARRTLPPPWGGGPSNLAALVLGLTFFNAFIYQGLGGSFEDARHLWLLLGLLFAASRLKSAGPAAT